MKHVQLLQTQLLSVAVWHSGNSIEHISEVTLCRDWLVLGWATIFGWAY